ncbi:MAG: DUF2752 domain-containing protein [Pseudomonadota bacterium]
MAPPSRPSLLDGTLLDRAISFVLLVPSATVLGMAAWMEPAAAGVGTHQQLGLGTCTMLQLTGYPCPMCGMTTTFTLAMHGRLLDALLCQPFGLALFSLTVATALVALLELVAPRRRWRRFWDWLGLKEGWIAGALLLGLLLGWVHKIFVMWP